jgi:exosortase A-associated hydrolase 2
VTQVSRLGELRQAEPFYFGTASQQLFGCYHAPRTGRDRRCGVLLCYPMGEEYIRFHRACRLLAARLSEAGFAALRFDYYGCGDSAGELEQASMDRWRADIQTALVELRRRCGRARICLIGLRLGATLSMQVAAEQAGIDGLVLWDPVVNGRAHIAELSAEHSRMLRRALVQPESPVTGPVPTEVLGFPLTHSLVGDLEETDLLTVQRLPAKRVLLIASHVQDNQQELSQHLTRLRANVEYRHVPSPGMWEWDEDVGRVVVPAELLRTVLAWVARVFS